MQNSLTISTVKNTTVLTVCSFKHLYKYLPDHAASEEDKVIGLVFVYRYVCMCTRVL